MTQQEMNILVPKKLKELERENNIRVIYAASLILLYGQS